MGSGVEEFLPSAHATVMCRAVQEALNNICKHAEAQYVSVTVHLDGVHVRLVVEDDGRGIGAGAGRSSGLRRMQERAELLGGSFDVESAANNGTAVYVALPVDTEGVS